MKKVLIGLSFFSLAISPAYAETNADYFTAPAATDIAEKTKTFLSTRHKRQALAFFNALEAENWSDVEEIISDNRDNILNPVFRAEYYLAANSPMAAAEDLLQLLHDAPDIAQSDQLRRLATRRGADSLPASGPRRQLHYQGSPSVRGKPKSVTGSDALAENDRNAILRAIIDSDPDQAKEIFHRTSDGISSESLTEWQQRIAWSYYIENRDADALEMAAKAIKGDGPWLGDSYWVYGLAAWRQAQYRLAADQFSNTARTANNPELVAAGYYWASRAWMRAGHPNQVSAALRSAAQYDISLYGVLAAQALGVDGEVQPLSNTISDSEWDKLTASQNGKIAVALITVGQSTLAEEALRYEARRADGAAHATLLTLARLNNLPSLQSWLSIYLPKDTPAQRLAAFPTPRWQPVNGWKVDPALVYAHILQESAFRPDAVSPADARGLMQLRPGTAADLGKVHNLESDNSALSQPEKNIALGQLFLKELATKKQTKGLLPKVIAAYNAGPSPVGRWNTEIRDNGDPLLYVESIPYAETRAYVGIILRNYWMYEAQAGIESQSAFGLAQGLWPRFPDTNGAELVRIAPINGRGFQGGDR